MPLMEYEEAVAALLQASASRIELGPAEKSLIKVECISPLPRLIEDTLEPLEDVEIEEHQSTAGSDRCELHVSVYEYLSLRDRFKRLERQYGEIQDLATAYSEVIRGFSPTDGLTVSIDQLQVEAGRNGLRAKALEADMLRPLIREAGGLQALISQTHTVRTLIEKAGGLQELEQFVLDLRTIRGTLDEMGGSQGLGSLASEVRHLLTIKQEYAELRSQMNGTSNLRAKAARYERLMQAFTDVQTDIPYRNYNATTAKSSPIHTTRSLNNAEAPVSGRPAAGDGSKPALLSMNPARARLISATPLEVDPDRDLYEATPPVTKPLNKTGSNNTPLGAPQAQSFVRPTNQAIPPSKLKRKRPEYIASSGPAKLLRADARRDSALVQASLIGAAEDSKERDSAHFDKTSVRIRAVSFMSQAQTDRLDTNIDRVKDAIVPLHTRTSGNLLRLPDRVHADVQFGNAGFTSTSGGQTPTYTSTTQIQISEPHADTRPAPSPLAMAGLSCPAPLSRKISGGITTEQNAV